MSMEVSGGVELREDIARMADLLRASGENGSRACSWILQNAVQPVLDQMLHNASTDPKRRTGTLLRSIKIGRVVKKRSGGYRVTDLPRPAEQQVKEADTLKTVCKA